MSSIKTITEVVLRLINIEEENIRLLSSQKLIPLPFEEFVGITLMDDNIRNLQTIEWDEETGRLKSWHHGTMEMVIDKWDENGIETLSDLGKLKRRDYFTPLGALYKTTIEDLHGNCFEQNLVEFDKDGIVKAETITHLETYNDSLDPEVVDIRLIKGNSSKETYRIIDGKQTARLDSEGNVIEEYIYNDKGLLVEVKNDYHRTVFEYDEFDNTSKITKEIIADHNEDLDEVTEIKYTYGERWSGQIETIEIGGQIIFSSLRYWMTK